MELFQRLIPESQCFPELIAVFQLFIFTHCKIEIVGLLDNYGQLGEQIYIVNVQFVIFLLTVE